MKIRCPACGYSDWRMCKRQAPKGWGVLLATCLECRRVFAKAEIVTEQGRQLVITIKYVASRPSRITLYTLNRLRKWVYGT